VDQQIGGLLMWVPCCFLYISIIMVSLARWYKAPEEGFSSSLTTGGVSPVAVGSVIKEEM
jgi:cytochrome c oxidase assembly factor CtaG